MCLQWHPFAFFCLSLGAKMSNKIRPQRSSYISFKSKSPTQRVVYRTRIHVKFSKKIAFANSPPRHPPLHEPKFLNNARYSLVVSHMLPGLKNTAGDEDEGYAQTRHAQKQPANPVSTTTHETAPTKRHPRKDDHVLTGSRAGKHSRHINRLGWPQPRQ